MPGVVAGVLELFDLVGLGQPRWYVGGVKLLFCALSLAVPAAMYWVARRHFGEAAARVALLAGAFRYELVGFAHKLMTEFVATAPLLSLLALCLRPTDGSRVVWQAAGLAVLTAAIRMQYAPLALLLLGIVLLRTRDRLHLVLASVVLLFAVGAFDALTWGRGLFHSYVTNLRYNMIIAEWRAGESPPYQFLWWLTLGGGGLSVLSLALALLAPPALRAAARARRHRAPGSLPPGAQGVPVHLRRDPPVAAARRGPRNPRGGVCGTRPRCGGP